MKIYFLNGNTPEMVHHYFMKEYRDDVMVEIDGLFYELYFFTSDRLGDELRKDTFFSLIGLVILGEITTERIITAIKDLRKRGFFDRFKGENTFNPNKRFAYDWYIGLTAPYQTSKDNYSVIEVE